MLSWILLLAPSLLFAWRGYNHGFIESVSRVVGLLSGYVCAILLTLPVGQWLADLTGLPGLLPFMLTSAFFLFGASAIISLLFDWIEHHWPDHLHSDHVGSFSGGLFGLCVGAFIGMLLIWCVSLAQGLLPINQKPPTALEKTSQRLAGQAIHLTLERFSPPPAVQQASAAFLQAPQETMVRIRRLSERQHLRALLTQPDNKAVLDSGDLKQLQQLLAFKELASDEDMQFILALTGRADKQQQRLAQGISDLWFRLQSLKQDPEFIALLKNPDFQQELKSGNPLTLMSSPELKRFTELLFTVEPEPESLKTKT
jgi:hypothetical protein